VLVHCASGLGSAAAILNAKLERGDGVLAMWAGERGHAVHRLDRVMPHSFKSSPLSRYDSEPKFLRRESASNPCACGESVASQLVLYFVQAGRWYRFLCL
jgi:hypothetical protein